MFDNEAEGHKLETVERRQYRRKEGGDYYRFKVSCECKRFEAQAESKQGWHGARRPINHKYNLHLQEEGVTKKGTRGRSRT